MNCIDEMKFALNTYWNNNLNNIGLIYINIWKKITPKLKQLNEYKTIEGLNKSNDKTVYHNTISLSFSSIRTK